MKTSALTPTRLRLILIVSLVLITFAGAGLFYLAYGRLKIAAVETGAQAASARESQDTLQKLQILKNELDAKRDIMAMTSLVTANSQNYAYQDLLVRDLTIYADRAQLTIKNINFSDSGVAAAGDPAATGAPAGLRKATVDITLETPVDYKNLLNFLYYIEQNLTKLKVSNVGMAKSGEGTVSVDILNLEVYIQ